MKTPFSSIEQTTPNRLCCIIHALLLLLVNLLVVEAQLLVLKNVAVSTSALTGTRADASQDLARRQLLDHLLLLHDRRLSLLHLDDHLGLSSLHLRQILQSHISLGTDLAGVVLLEPGLERRGIDRHNAALHNRVRTHQLVVGSVVHNVQNLGLGGEG